MRAARATYIAAVLLVGAGTFLSSFMERDSGRLLLLSIYHLLAVMTYPVGFAASLVCDGTVWLGVLSPEEALVVTTPLFAILGYLQWFRLLPHLYRRKS
jgi:hypothetical protein